MPNRDIYDIINTCASVFSAIGTVGAVSLTMYMLYSRSKQRAIMTISIGSIWQLQNGGTYFISNESCTNEFRSIATELHKLISINIKNVCEHSIDIDSLYISTDDGRDAKMLSPLHTEPDYSKTRILPFTSESFNIRYELIINNRFIETEKSPDKLKLFMQTTMQNTFSVPLPCEIKYDLKERRQPTAPPQSSNSNPPDGGDDAS